MTSAFRVLCVIGLAVACQDPAVPLTAENNVRVTNQAGYFRLQVDNMDNVIQDTTFTWVATDSQSKVLHRSLIPHGEADIVIHDAADSLVYSGILDYEKDSMTYKGNGRGTPGPWTIDIIIKAATGKIDVTLEHP